MRKEKDQEQNKELNPKQNSGNFVQMLKITVFLLG